MDELQEAREIINRVDREMAALFEERMHAAEKVAAYKREHALPVKDEKRENELIARNTAYIGDSVIAGYYTRFLRETIDLSCEYQERLMDGMRVAYAGVPGAFAYLAAKKMFPGARLFPFPDFIAAYEAVEKENYDAAVLPLENSQAGEVGAVMDLVFFRGLFVNQVCDLPVTHHLLVKPGTKKEEITTVISHPQALEQCAATIRKNGWKTEACENTALAGQLTAASERRDLAAIASEETARFYNLSVLESGINDNKNNTTRFAAFSRSRQQPAGSKNNNFILVFTVKNEAGALARTLNIIGAHGYNLRSLRSRPMKDPAWNFYFYLEAEGSAAGENGRDLLRELSAVCDRLKLVGEYEER